MRFAATRCLRSYAWVCGECSFFLSHVFGAFFRLFFLSVYLSHTLYSYVFRNYEKTPCDLFFLSLQIIFHPFLLKPWNVFFFSFLSNSFPPKSKPDIDILITRRNNKGSVTSSTLTRTAKCCCRMHMAYKNAAETLHR